MGHFGRVNLACFYVGSFWPILVGCFCPMPPPPHTHTHTLTHTPILYNINETAHNDKVSFMTSHTILCSTAVSKESHTAEKDDDTYPNPFRAFATYKYKVGKLTKI